MIKALIYSFLFLLCVDTSAQNEYNKQLWFDINTSYFISKKKNFISDIGYRNQSTEEPWSQVVLRPGFKYTMSSHWKLAGGIGYFNKFTNDENIEKELRIYQGLIYTTSFYRRFTFVNYLRVEERFIQLPEEGNYASLRFRYQLTIDINLIKKVSQTLSIPLSAEVFTNFDNINSSLFAHERSRFFTGVEYKSYDNWKLSLLLNVQGNKESSETTFAPSDVFLRVRLLWYIKESSSYRTDN